MPPQSKSNPSHFQRNLIKTIQRCLKTRRTTAKALLKLDQAWKACSQTLPSLNRKPLWVSITEEPLKTTMQQTETKIRNLEILQQKAFLMFQDLCHQKYENQIQHGEQILKSLKIKHDTKTYATALQNTAVFLTEETKINRENIKNVKHIYKKSEALLKNIEKTSLLPCNDHKTEKILQKKIKVLKNFLINTGKLLAPIAKPLKSTQPN
jgi:hypothetical protein